MQVKWNGTKADRTQMNLDKYGFHFPKGQWLEGIPEDLRKTFEAEGEFEVEPIVVLRTAREEYEERQRKIKSGELK